MKFSMIIGYIKLKIIKIIFFETSSKVNKRIQPQGLRKTTLG